MKEIPIDVLRIITDSLVVIECLRFEQALQMKIHDKQHYLKRKEWEPLTNTLRLFKRGIFRTYRIHSYVKDGITLSDVIVSPLCRTFQCKHKQKVSPSVANHWILSCVTEGNTNGYGYIKYKGSH